MNLFRTLMAEMAHDYVPSSPDYPIPQPIQTNYVLDQALVILDASQNNGYICDPTVVSWLDLSEHEHGNNFTVSNITWNVNKCEITAGLSDCYGTQLTQNRNITIEICCEINDTIGNSEKPLIADFSINGGSIGIQNASFTNGIGMTYCDEYNSFHDYNMLTDSDFVQNKIYTFTISIDDQGTIKGYVDSIKVLEENNQPLLPTSSHITYKAFGRENGSLLSGAIYSIRIYNKVLTDNEIEQNYINDARFAPPV